MERKAAFANSISQQIGGEEGSFVYFEIATVLNCTPCGNAGSPTNLSWPKIKEGYAALERLYCTSNLKLNRFAFLTVKFRDKSAAEDQMKDRHQKDLELFEPFKMI
jgi:hypothetical protein